MGTQREHYGGSIRITISADKVLSRLHAWLWQITASGGGLAVQLPDARRLITGYPVIQVLNEGATAFAIEDFDGTVIIASVAQDEVYTFALFDNSTAAGDWEQGLWTESAGAGPAVVTFPWTLGGNDSGMLRNAWRYDFVADTWSEPNGLSTSTGYIFAAGFVINGVGFAADGTTPLFESFDPNVWASLTARAVSSRNASGTNHPNDDKGYVFGAEASVDALRADEYDVSGAAWTALTDMTVTRHKFGMQPGGGTKILYHAGATSFLAFHDATTHMREYDAAADSHSSKTSSLVDRLYFGSALDRDGDFWAYAGDEDSNGPEQDVTEQYDLSGDNWSTMIVAPQGAHSEGGVTRIKANGMNYTIGGSQVGNPDAVYRHNPQNDTYVAKTDHGASAANARGICQGTTLSLSD